LGNVLYWAGCGLAVILLLLSAASAIFGEGEARTFGIVLLAVLGLPVLLVARACRHVLAGR
jgi:hypothetical protein